MIKAFLIFWVVLFIIGISFPIWLIYYMVKKRKSAAHQDIKKKLIKDLKKKSPKLSSHQNHDVYHLHTQKSSYLTIDGLSSNRGKGVLTNENESSFLYYTWIDPVVLSSKVQLLAKTTSATYYIRLLKDIMVFKTNDEIIGLHQISTGLFFNTKKEVIGQINMRTGNTPNLNDKYGHLDFNLFRDNKRDDYPIEFKSGLKARITNKSTTTGVLAVSFLTETASKLEKDLLMAYAIQYVVLTTDNYSSGNDNSGSYDDSSFSVFDLLDIFD